MALSPPLAASLNPFCWSTRFMDITSLKLDWTRIYLRNLRHGHLLHLIPGNCPLPHFLCNDKATCVEESRFCDGVEDCPLVSVVFIGPRCPWGPIYGSGCLSLTD